MNIGRLLRGWRKYEGLNLHEGARILGLSYRTLQRIENGEEMEGRNLAAILFWLLS